MFITVITTDTSAELKGSLLSALRICSVRCSGSCCQTNTVIAQQNTKVKHTINIEDRWIITTIKHVVEWQIRKTLETLKRPFCHDETDDKRNIPILRFESVYLIQAQSLTLRASQSRARNGSEIEYIS